MVNQIYYLNTDKFPAIVNDYKQVKNYVTLNSFQGRIDERPCDAESSSARRNDGDIVKQCVFEALPPVRRVASLPDKVHKGDYVPALGLASLALINLPEDLRDIKTAKEQVEAFLKGQKYEGAYNYRDFQHEFSFFRGTLLEFLVDFKKTGNIERAKKLYALDKSLLRTKFGERIMNLLGVEQASTETVKKFNKKTGLWEAARDINGKRRIALKFDGSAFGKLTARAMARTTLIGTGVLAAIELPKILKAMTKGNNIGEKAENTAKQTAKSALNFAATTVGIAYGGAIGSKYLKGFGSIVGMGIGAVLTSKASQKLQNAID